MHDIPKLSMPTPDGPEQARKELAQLLRGLKGVEERLGCREGSQDIELIQSLLKHDSPFAVLRTVGFSAAAATRATRLLKECSLTPSVRDLARNIEERLTPRVPASPARTPGMRKTHMVELNDSPFDWSKQTFTPKKAPPVESVGETPPSGRTSKWTVGQKVRAAFSEDGLRMVGVVTCAEPLEVRPQGMSDGFQFPVVEALDETTPEKCMDGSNSVDSDLKALEMAKLCIQQGMPQMAKLYMNMVGASEGPVSPMPDLQAKVADGVDGADEDVKTLELPRTTTPSVTPMMVSIQEEGSLEGDDTSGRSRQVPQQFPPPMVAQKSREDIFTPPTSLPVVFDPNTSEALLVNDEGAPVVVGADGARYYCGRPLDPAAAAIYGNRSCGPLDGPQCSSCRHLHVQLKALESLFYEGQRVRFADHEADEWKEGVVTGLNPLMVQPNGFQESFQFNLVEPIDSLPVASGSSGSGTEADGSNVQKMLGYSPRSRQEAAGKHQSLDTLDGDDAQSVMSDGGRSTETAMCTARSTSSAPGVPPWHHLAKTIDTCAAPRPAIPPLTIPSGLEKNLTRALLPSPKEDKAMGSAWLACCYSR